MTVTSDYKQLLKPDVINSVSGLSLIARVVVDGYLSGLNRSKRIGAGLEFSQYRGYESGDDLRLLDWKMLARSGRYYIKQSEIDTHINVKFVVDNSSSMLHREGGITKSDYANVLIASLAKLAHIQGDGVGLLLINNKTIDITRPAIGKQHFNSFLYQLIERHSAGAWPRSLSSEKVHHRHEKELIFFITDFYESGTEITEMVRQLKTPRNEVVVFHIMGEAELNFTYSGQLIFEDLESGNKLKVNTKEEKSAYIEKISTHIANIKEQLLSKDIGYELFTLDSNIGEALQLFLKKRRNLI